MESSEAKQFLFTGWASDLFKQLEELEKQFTGEGNRVSRPKIQEIPKYMAEKMEFQRYYRPQVISLGAFHARTSQGERYKGAWAAMYLKDTDLNLEDLYRKMYDMNINKQAASLKPMWAKLYNDGANSLNASDPIVDGCCVLQLLQKSDNSVDSEQELKISIDKLVRVHQDLLILDNQIPFQLLRLLCEDQERLQKCLCNFLQVHGIQTAPKLPTKKTENEEVKVAVDGDDDDEDPVHLLDYLRRALLMRDQHTFYKAINNNEIKKGSLHLRKYRIGTIRELKAAGIRVIKYSHGNPLYPHFHNGRLQLPELVVDGTMAQIFLNLVAYEMCPDFRNNFEISSFLVFMSSLVDQPEDVKELRMAAIIINELASDKEVADLFNKMDIILVPETPWFANIRDQIHLHFESKRGQIKILTWMGEATSTFFRSPWTIIALLAATLGLVLTFIQTWFAIHPKSS